MDSNAVPAPPLAMERWSLGFTRVWAIVSLIAGILLFLVGITGRTTVL